MSSLHLNDEGRVLVLAELRNKGIDSLVVVGSRRKVILATSNDGKREIQIRIKTKRRGSWHTTLAESKPSSSVVPLTEEIKFWIFIDFESSPRFWIVPERWIQNDIYEAHEKYLEKYGGHRAQNDDSDHHSVTEDRIAKWEDRWDALKIK